MTCVNTGSDARRRHAAALIAAGKTRAATAYRLMLCCTASQQGTICPHLVKGPGVAIVKCTGGGGGPREMADLYALTGRPTAACPQGVW